MTGSIPERDWKVFRELREAALDRFCRHALDEIATRCTASLQIRAIRHLGLLTEEEIRRFSEETQYQTRPG